MKTVIELNDLRTVRAQLPKPLGLVPTMGFLHQGHLSLVRRARQDCASVVVSIFVNPTQFGPSEDLEAYPRDISRDLALLEAAGVDLVWLPTPETMYPPDFQTWVTVEKITQTLEGAMRPGHFRGVTTVVTKLFNAVTPHKAYFGQKDAQQAIVIQQMVRDLNFPLEIIICPIIREADGLAMSSRNTYLNPDERQAATVLYRALTAAKAAFEEGERDAERLRRILTETIQSEPLAELKYVSVASPSTLAELEQVKAEALFSVAVYVGNTRLIDNFLLQNGRWMVGEKVNRKQTPAP
jgi:pantoate--beta-alanine ligase